MSEETLKCEIRLNCGELMKFKTRKIFSINSLGLFHIYPLLYSKKWQVLERHAAEYSYINFA